MPVVFLALAKHISAHWDIEVRIIDYRDGYMARNLDRRSKIKFIEFADGVPCKIGPDTVLVMQTILPYAMRPELRIVPDTRIVYWDLFPYNLINILLPLPYFRNLQFRHKGLYKFVMKYFMPALKARIQELVEDLTRKDGLLFHDDYTVKLMSDWLDLTISRAPKLRVPIEIQPFREPALNRKRNILHFAWVGRLCDFKIHILAHTLDRLSRYATDHGRQIEFHVIGNGDQRHLITEHALESDYFKIHLLGALESHDLEKYLIDRIDILTAMGASALLGAKLSLPVVLLDFSHVPIIGDYKFRWLFDSEDPGHDITPEDIAPGNTSLESMIRAIDGDYRSLAWNTYEHCRARHDINLIAEELLQAAGRTAFAYRDISPELLKKSSLRKAYTWVRLRLASAQV